MIANDLGKIAYKNVQNLRNPRMDTIKHLRYLKDVVDPKYKKQFEITANALEDAQKNLWPAAKKKLKILENITFEHKIPQSFIDAGYADKIEFAKVTPTPRSFNEIKFRSFDVPLRKIIKRYEEASNPAAKQVLFEKMQDLKKNFSSKYGGYLDDVKIEVIDDKIKLRSTGKAGRKNHGFI